MIPCSVRRKRWCIQRSHACGSRAVIGSSSKQHALVIDQRPRDCQAALHSVGEVIPPGIGSVSELSEFEKVAILLGNCLRTDTEGAISNDTPSTAAKFRSVFVRRMTVMAGVDVGLHFCDRPRRREGTEGACRERNSKGARMPRGYAQPWRVLRQTLRRNHEYQYSSPAIALPVCPWQERRWATREFLAADAVST